MALIEHAALLHSHASHRLALVITRKSLNFHYGAPRIETNFRNNLFNEPSNVEKRRRGAATVERVYASAEKRKECPLIVYERRRASISMFGAEQCKLSNSRSLEGLEAEREREIVGWVDSRSVGRWRGVERGKSRRRERPFCFRCPGSTSGHRHAVLRREVPPSSRDLLSRLYSN